MGLRKAHRRGGSDDFVQRVDWTLDANTHVLPGLCGLSHRPLNGYSLPGGHGSVVGTVASDEEIPGPTRRQGDIMGARHLPAE